MQRDQLQLASMNSHGKRKKVHNNGFKTGKTKLQKQMDMITHQKIQTDDAYKKNSPTVAALRFACASFSLVVVSRMREDARMAPNALMLNS